MECGTFHTIALTKLGDIYTFGFNGNGRLGLAEQSTATFQRLQVSRLPAGGENAGPVMSAIEQAISESFNSSFLDNERPLPAQARRRADENLDAGSHAKAPKHIFRILQEPIYGKVSNQVLRDFNSGSLGALENKYRLSQKNVGASVSREMLTAFRQAPGLQEMREEARVSAFEDLSWPGDAARHRAATLIQRRVRGYLVRRDAQGLRCWLLFRRLTEKAETRSRDAAVSQLVRALRLAHQGVKEQKQALLNGYITYCAVRI